MTKEQRKALIAAGFKIGTAQDFLGLTDHETIKDCEAKKAEQIKEADFYAPLDWPWSEADYEADRAIREWLGEEQ